ncbi:MAG: exo-alpha-sialidase [Thermoplasmata archaeon]|nr:MAG: exo-alpha-sialidase [Thermoplasmata archaeon]
MWIGKSSDGGISFDFVKRINKDINWSQEQPSIAVGPDGKVHVVWIDVRENLPGIYYANSTDGGHNFNPSVRVMDTTVQCGVGGSVMRHLIAVDKNNKIHVVWSDNRTGGNNYFIYYANSTNGGISFNPNVKVSDSVAPATEPSVAVNDNTNIYVVWTDYRNISTKGSDIYFAKSTDGGISFSPNKRVNDDLGNTEQLDVSIAVNNGIIGIVWDDWRSGENIYFTNSTDEGENFSPNKKVNDDVPGSHWISSIAINKTGYIGVAWMDGRNGNSDIYFANSTDGGNTFSSNQRVNDDVGTENQYTPHIAMDDNGHVYIVWQDFRSGTNWEIYLSRSNWEPPMTTPLSPPIDSTLINTTPSLKVNPVIDPDNDTIYYNFTISDQADAESGTVYYSGWITSTSWKPPPLLDGKWYWHTYTYDGFNITSPNWVWNFTIDTSQCYDIQLYEGWNLISIPFIQMDTDLFSVLNSINGSYDAVQWYNTGDNSDHWKQNHILKPSRLNDLGNIDQNMGFWVHITQTGGVLLECSGIIPTENQSITLKTGWNLIGYPSLSNNSVSTALNNLALGDDVDSIWTYNATIQNWEELREPDYFKRGKGYWIHSKVEKIWNVLL